MGILEDIRAFFRGIWVDGVARPLPEATYLCVKRCIFFGWLGISTGVIFICLAQTKVISYAFFPLGYVITLLSLFFASITGLMAYVGTDGIRRIATEENVPPYVPPLGVRSRSWFSRWVARRTEPRTPPSTASSRNPEDGSTSSGRTIQVGEDIPLRNLQEPGSSTGEGACSSREPAGEGACSSREPAGEGACSSREPAGEGACSSREPAGEGACSSREPAGEGACSAESTRKASTSVVNRFFRNLFQKQPEPQEN